MEEFYLIPCVAKFDMLNILEVAVTFYNANGRLVLSVCLYHDLQTNSWPSFLF